MADFTAIQVFKGPSMCDRGVQQIFMYCRFLECVHEATEKSYVGNQYGMPLQSILSSMSYF